MLSPEATVKSVPEYLEWASKAKRRTDHVLYRGQRKPWQLLPSICRYSSASSLLEREQELLACFKREATRCLHVEPTNDWDWLVVAQHHGLPTRLLDWTSNSKIALWFALEEVRNALDSEPVVWQLCPDAGDFVTEQNEQHPFRGTRTKLFETTFNIPRVRAQHGYFSLFKHSGESKNGFVALEQNRYLKKSLAGVRISLEHAEMMLLSLEKEGLNRHVIYPPSVDAIAKLVKKHVLVAEPIRTQERKR
ncbi:FRG domain-containing protein [Aeromonas caviae]|uniref:FRG domain-containing protein n=1 Tax=Aeromonas caviae TaxID=648 RepID=UPI003F749952